ncbi:hypothetical protein ACFL49_01830 [Candidatus Omnitrophota bacterium]
MNKNKRKDFWKCLSVINVSLFVKRCSLLVENSQHVYIKNMCKVIRSTINDQRSTK